MGTGPDPAGARKAPGSGRIALVVVPVMLVFAVLMIVMPRMLAKVAPDAYARINPAGCYLIYDDPVFQLRDGQVLLPTGAKTGVTYRVERIDRGNIVVTDRELRLIEKDNQYSLKLGASESRTMPLEQSEKGPYLALPLNDYTRPGYAFHQAGC